MAFGDDNREARTERPTARRRRAARARGEVARSPELLLAARASAVWIVLTAWLAYFSSAAAEFVRDRLTHAGSEPIATREILNQSRSLTVWFSIHAGTPLLIASVAMLFGHVLQVGWLWHPQRILPRSDRISMWSGLARIGSFATLGRFIAGITKIAILTTLSGWMLLDGWPLIATISDAEFTSALAMLSNATTRLVAAIAMALVVWGLLDYALARWRFKRSLRMTPDELRRESKESEGDPNLRRRRETTTRNRLDTHL